MSKKYLFHRFHTIFNEEFKNQGLESLRQRFEDLLRKITIRTGGCLQVLSSLSIHPFYPSCRFVRRYSDGTLGYLKWRIPFHILFVILGVFVACVGTFTTIQDVVQAYHNPDEMEYHQLAAPLQTAN